MSDYHPGHVRKLMHQLGFTVQRPTRKLARADPQKQDRWHRHTYPNLKKKPQRIGAAADPLRCRQRFDRTRRCTTPGHDAAARSVVPVTGQRTTVKVFGCVDVHAARFLYRREEVFRYRHLPGIPRADRATLLPSSSDLVPGQRLVSQARRRLGVVLRASALVGSRQPAAVLGQHSTLTERLWHHTRHDRELHNRYFTSQEELNATLTRVFRSMQRQP